LAQWLKLSISRAGVVVIPFNPAMFQVSVISDKFVKMPLVKQHKMVQDLLKDEIKNMHGITIKTKSQ
jgi:stress-induced morphogen